MDINFNGLSKNDDGLKRDLKGPFTSNRKESSANMWVLKKKDPNIWRNGFWVNGHGKNSRKLTLYEVTGNETLNYYMG
jgi:hypothetical protein